MHPFGYKTLDVGARNHAERMRLVVSKLTNEPKTCRELQYETGIGSRSIAWLLTEAVKLNMAKLGPMKPYKCRADRLKNSYVKFGTGDGTRTGTGMGTDRC